MLQAKMMRFGSLRLTLAFALALATLAGCDPVKPRSETSAAAPQTTPKQPAAAPAHESEHDRDDQAEHEHGEHAGHAHKAPHGGLLVALGEHAANVEIVFEPKDATIRLYVLDGCAENAIRIAQSAVELRVRSSQSASERVVSLTARENPLTGEKPGDASEFSGNSELKDAAAWDAVLTRISVRGSEYRDVRFSWSGKSD